MSAIPIGNRMPGFGANEVISYPGAPGAETNEVHTLTFGGTITAGAGSTFTPKFGNRGSTTPIAWSATNATLLANINAAVRALLGSSNVTAAIGSMTAGIGTITLTYVGALAGTPVPAPTITNNLTGTAPTVTVAETTPGVQAALRGAPVGTLVVDTTNSDLYQNTGTPAAPIWTVNN